MTPSVSITMLTPRRAALIATVIFGTLLAVFALWQLRSIVLLFVVSLAVAGMIRAPIDFLVARRVPRGLATAVIVLIGVIVIVGALVILGPMIVGQLPSLATDALEAYARLRADFATPTLIGQLAGRLLPTSEVLRSALSNGPGVSVDVALGTTLSVVDAFTQSSVVIVLAIYWTTDRLIFERLWLSLLPPDRRIRARTIWRGIEDEVGAYLRSEAAQTLLTGVLLFVGFGLLGVKYPLVLATLAALLWLVPIVGALIALPLMVLIAGLSGLVAALATGVLTLLIYVLMEFVVEPKLYRRRRFGTIWTVLAALALLDALGVIGLFIAPIVATVAQIVLEEWLKPVPIPVVTTPVVELSLLRTRLAEARASLNADETEQLPPYALGLLSRMDKLIDEAAQEIT